MRCVPIGTHLLLTCGISEERKFQTNVNYFEKMVIFDTVSVLFWGCFLCSAEASLSLCSLRDYETSSLQVLPQILQLRFADYETTRLQVYNRLRPTVVCCPSSVVRNSVVPQTPLSPLLARPHPCIPPYRGILRGG